MSERNDAFFYDVADATTLSPDFDPFHDLWVNETGDGLPEVVVLDDTDPSLTPPDGYLIERNRQLRETLRLLQDALAEWVVISDPAAAQ